MLDVYTHELADTSSDVVLASWGIKTKNNNTDIKPAPVNCICGTPNKPDSKYCTTCKRVLSYEGTVEKEEEKKKQQEDMESLEKRMEELQTEMQR